MTLNIYVRVCVCSNVSSMMATTVLSNLPQIWNLVIHLIAKTKFVDQVLRVNGCLYQSINKFISCHSTEARATVRLCWIKEKCPETDLKCVNGWSSSTVQWKRVPKSRSSNRETTSSSVQIVWRNWQKLLCGWSQQARLTVWADQIPRKHLPPR